MHKLGVLTNQSFFIQRLQNKASFYGSMVNPNKKSRKPEQKMFFVWIST
jgi:hypothetical protein